MRSTTSTNQRSPTPARPATSSPPSPCSRWRLPARSSPSSTSTPPRSLRPGSGSTAATPPAITTDGPSGTTDPQDLLSDSALTTFRLDGQFVAVAERWPSPPGSPLLVGKCLGAILVEPLTVSSIARTMGSHDRVCNAPPMCWRHKACHLPRQPGPPPGHTGGGHRCRAQCRAWDQLGACSPRRAVVRLSGCRTVGGRACRSARPVRRAEDAGVGELTQLERHAATTRGVQHRTR